MKTYVHLQLPTGWINKGLFPPLLQEMNNLIRRKEFLKVYMAIKLGITYVIHV